MATSCMLLEKCDMMHAGSVKELVMMMIMMIMQLISTQPN